MDPAALASLCVLLMQGAADPLPPGLHCQKASEPSAIVSVVPGPDRSGRSGTNLSGLAALVTGVGSRDGIARVAYSEAANQGDSGLAAVVYTILNRLGDGRWGGTVDAVLNASHQFEPVMRAGGNWRSLRPVSEAYQARVDTIINLALEGRLPDLTNGARYFQNPRIVAERAGAGQVAASVVNFGGAPPSAVIGAHSFYVEAGRGGGRLAGPGAVSATLPTGSDVILKAAGGAIFVVNSKAADDAGVVPDPAAGVSTSPPPPRSDAAAAVEASSPMGSMFVIAGHPGTDN
jgi:N-acetylmuramoyl-L-alanine amidase